jgi:putative ABC transport system permease protein
MGRLTLITRLAVRDLRYRPSEAVLLLLAITAAAPTLTLGLVLHRVTSGPYQRTRAATAGPDLVASVFPGSASQPAVRSNLIPLRTASGVTASSGPYPVTFARLRGSGYIAGAMIEGRSETPSGSTGRCSRRAPGCDLAPWCSSGASPPRWEWGLETG